MSAKQPEQILLEQGLIELGLQDKLDQLIEPLLHYSALLQKWGKVHNLTAILEPKAIISQHFLDSLSIHSYLNADRILDVGSGAGFPGIPLALAFPESEFFLLDTSGKRMLFLAQVLAELKINNVTLVKSRVEDYKPENLFNCIVTRAFAAMSKIVVSVEHLCDKDAHILAMKGKYPAEELEQLPAGFKLISASELTVPGVEGERHLITVGK